MKYLLETCKEFLALNKKWYGLKFSTRDVKTIAEALEKRTPKKPKPYIEENEHEFCPVCPSCADFLMPNGEKYCSSCGQAIEW